MKGNTMSGSEEEHCITRIEEELYSARAQTTAGRDRTRGKSQ
jgi:hypothetical protein